jgi:hypothetical protein
MVHIKNGVLYSHKEECNPVTGKKKWMELEDNMHRKISNACLLSYVEIKKKKKKEQKWT